MVPYRDGVCRYFSTLSIALSYGPIERPREYLGEFEDPMAVYLVSITTKAVGIVVELKGISIIAVA